jgi:glycosyltransferase involved in cell wall biosynthesis
MADVSTEQTRPVTNGFRQSLCLLTWNEVEGCKNDLPELPLDAFEEVFAVDGGSTDGTVEYLTGLGIPVHRQSARGYNQAYLEAFGRCTTDALVLYHPKGTIDAGALLKFRPLFEQGADLIIASRIVEGAVNEEDSSWWRPRKWFVISLGVLAALLWRRRGPWIRDVLHGFRGMRKERFFAIEPLDSGLAIDIEMVARAYRKRFRAVEFPVMERPRIAGETHFKAFRTGRILLAYIWFELKRKV